MKRFVVYAKVELTQKPEWLDNFRLRYDKPYEYHITLKQPCFTEDDQAADIKFKLGGLFSNLKISNKISLTFDTLRAVTDESTDIMIYTKNTEITSLQKNIVSALSAYDQYQKKEYKRYEENFEPHITIARNLDERSYASAAKELEQDYICKGFIDSVVLAVVENPIVSEVNDPRNQTIYKLHSESADSPTG